MNLWVPYMRSDVHPDKNACMLSTCTCVLEDAVTGCSCCLYSRDKFSSHASLFATCCFPSSRCFHQCSQSSHCFLFRYYTCKVWTDWFDLYFHQSLWWDPQFTTCCVHFTIHWSAVSFADLCLHLWRTATLKGLALANFMFVYVFFILCLCRDGFCEFDFSKDEVLKRAFVYDGVSCPNVTSLTGR